MARGNRRGPRCTNSWRPSDGPLFPQAERIRRQRSPVPLEHPERATIAYTPRPSARLYSNTKQRMTPASSQATPEPPIQTFENPNLMPVMSRYSHRVLPSSPVGDRQQCEDVEDERLPKVWHTSIDDLIRRTAHDYDLVMNYERDAEGGQRWTTGDIAQIREVGKNLHRDIFALRRWQRVVAQQGGHDKIMMMHIKREADFLKLSCERVQTAIVKYEQQCEFELLRDGVYAQDEDGNFYKPISPQDFVAENSYFPRISTEGMVDDSQDHRQNQDCDRDAYQDHCGAMRLKTPPATELSSLPKRSIAFDFASQSTPFDRLRREATREQSEAMCRTTASRSERVIDESVYEPRYHTRSPDSAHSALSAEDIKPTSRGRNTFYTPNGVSRRQAKKARVRDRSPRPTAGRLGKHTLHY